MRIHVVDGTTYRFCTERKYVRWCLNRGIVPDIPQTFFTDYKVSKIKEGLCTKS